MNEQSSVSAEKTDTTRVRKGVAIVSLVLAIFLPIVGLIGSIVSLVWAKRSGASTKLPVWGIVLSIVMIALSIVLGVIAFVILTNAVNAGALDLEALCAHRSSWGWLLDSLRYVCR